MPAVPICRGDIVWVNLEGAVGAEKHKTRPCVVVQNDGGNKRSPITIVAPITNGANPRPYRQHVVVEAAELGPGAKRSVVDCGQLRTIDQDHRIDKSRGVTAHLTAATMAKIDIALRASLAL